MSEEMNHGHSGREAGFEREDLGARGVFIFMIGLAVVAVVIYFVIIGLYSFLDKYERSRMATASPLVTSSGAMSRVVKQEYMEQRFKDNGVPMLEVNERGQFRQFLLQQENQLNSYGWVDEKARVAHIPIERAMELLVQRGLPVYTQGAAEASKKVPSKVPAQKSAATKQ
jgi:hypothetical protein